MVWSPDGSIAAVTWRSSPQGQSEANARLIASAPELLPIVELIAGIELPPVAEGWPDDRPLIGYRETVITVGHVRAARAAISKATGGA